MIMDDSARHDVELPGCTPEPLMAYLKALGILRLVSKQADPDARGWWRNDAFWLRCPELFNNADTNDAKRDSLAAFFLEKYRPTPIVVPWSGGDFFVVNWSPKAATHAKTPTSSKAIEAILATQTDRFEPYRRALQGCKAALDKCGIDTKEKMGKQKWTFIQELRSFCDEPLLIEWMDAAAVGTVERFAALLGSGGGSDGNTHFSDNFMQNLWDVLPDFDNQRQAGRDQSKQPVDDISRELLHDALFKAGTNRLIVKRTSSLYDSGAVGGPNATQGMERESLSNPWNVILALEGTIGFASAATKRLATNAASDGAFPFQVSASVTVQDGLADKERTGTEVWLPHWTRPVRSDEVLALLREGRAHCGQRVARTGLDMARAIASLGVDRGVGAFGRYAILKGRVGGENYNTAASLGRFLVAERQHVDLFREVDPWLDRFCRAAGDKNAPPRFGSALRRIDSAIFDFCRYGGAAFFQKVIVALGAAERELANAERFREDKKLKPLAGLSTAWIEAARAPDNGEFDIALALAGVRHETDKREEQPKIGPLRANLEPVSVWYDKNEGKQKANWAAKDRSVVWNAADLVANLAGVLARRMMDGARAGCERLPLTSRYTAPLDAIAAFIAGNLDDQRIEGLIWGLMLIDTRRRHPARAGMNQSRDRQRADPNPLPREYALLKLLFLPRPFVPERSGESFKWRLARRLAGGRMEGGLVIRPEPRILPLLRAGRIGEACRIAAQRLRVSGLAPMPGPLPTGVMRDDNWSEGAMDSRRAQRIAAALLIPISSKSVNCLVDLVCRGESAAADALALAAEGETE